jgi:murein DD-endopeptidase MepM/ murein hydrolase activator NlpD
VASTHFTLMIVPDAHQNVRRVQVSKRRAFAFLLALMFSVSAVSTVLVHYAFLIQERFVAERLRAENVRLTAEIEALASKVEGIDGHLQTVRRFDEKLRSMTDLNDDGRDLALGPIEQGRALGGVALADEPFAAPLAGDDPFSQRLRASILDGRMAGLAREAERQADLLGDLVDHLAARDAILSATPSVWPIRGWVTSAFGQREDPFTGERIMHLGLDVAAPEGAVVRAPARGLIIHAGERGAYGNMIAIDHGRGVVTHYAHLSGLNVKVGERIERSHPIGSVGNTGRSTGPHLHYEVRVNGVPVNPHRFVLD